MELAEEGEDAETWEDAMDEMEDVWMREPTGLKVITADSCCLNRLHSA